jgi:hypothetical protein
MSSMSTINAPAARPLADLQADLADARNRCAWARFRLENAKGAAARRLAMEDIEYEGNRAAFLQSWIRGRA